MRAHRAAAALIAAVLATGVAADPMLPTLFAGNGVSNGEVIDIRTAPEETAPVIAHIPPDARDVEVVQFDASGEWGRVNHAEASGWISLARLAEQDGVWPEGSLPQSFTCFGTEPFWSLGVGPEAADFSMLGTDTVTLPVTGILATRDRDDSRRVVIAEDGSLHFTLAALPALCSDNMSDRVFGITANVIRAQEGPPELLRGCCSISP